MEKNQEPKNKPPQVWSLIFDKGAKNASGEMIVSSTNGVEKTG